MAVPGRCTTSISIGEPPGCDWRGSKMAVLKYLICGFFLVGVVGPILMELYQGEGDAANWWELA